MPPTTEIHVVIRKKWWYCDAIDGVYAKNYNAELANAMRVRTAVVALAIGPTTRLSKRCPGMVKLF